MAGSSNDRKYGISSVLNLVNDLDTGNPHQWASTVSKLALLSFGTFGTGKSFGSKCAVAQTVEYESDPAPTLKKKDKHQLKREAFLQRLELTQSPYSKSHQRRIKQKAKEQTGHGLKEIWNTLESVDDDLSFGIPYISKEESSGCPRVTLKMNYPPQSWVRPEIWRGASGSIFRQIFGLHIALSSIYVLLAVKPVTYVNVGYLSSTCTSIGDVT
ncbi:MAG: hypothetical protein NXY57DRAFT_1044101 [Lentinula lateritia]|nr:MAG: hypothetical protein NXY57DRAFT_1044101 [Lentinula lateritia]